MNRRGDPIDGVMLLDKPEGLSSNAALQIVRRLLNAQKAGHTGTLDPMATGLLPLCFGNATKYSADLLHADKGYTARVQLGVKTDTGDRMGEVIERRSVEGLTLEVLQAAAASFTGPIEQIPPMYSALKHQGQALYALARKGETVEREPRRVVIHSLEISDFTGDAFTMTCLVSKGTYIRVLAEDIGEKLGVGAHLTALRRTRVGTLTLEGAATLDELRALERPEAVRTKLTGSDALLSTLARIDLSESDAARFMLGQRLPRISGTPGRVRVYGCGGSLLGTARLDDRGTLSPERLIAH